MGVEHLEDPLEGHEGRHDVHPGVGELGQGAVELGHEDAHGGQRADGDAAADGQRAAHPVGHRGAEGAEGGQRDDERLAVQGAADADVSDPTGPVGEAAGLLGGAAVELGQLGTRHVEPLGHGCVHRGVEVHALASDFGHLEAHPAGREYECRDQHEGQQGDAPLQHQQGDQRGDGRDAVGHDRSERAGQGPLGAHHVVVQAADQRAGLGAGEKREGESLDVVEQRHPEVEDEALADPGRCPPLGERQRGLGERGADHQQAEDGQVAAIARWYGVVDDLPEQQWWDDAEERAGDHAGQEAGDEASVGAGEAPDPPAGGAAHALRAALLHGHAVEEVAGVAHGPSLGTVVLPGVAGGSTSGGNGRCPRQVI